MSKKSFTILVIIFVIIGLLGIGFVLYLNAKKNSTNGQVTLKDFFPFGKGGTSVTPPGGVDNGTTGIQQQPGVTPTSIPRLRKVSQNPVVGYTTVEKSVPVDPNNLPAPQHKAVAATFVFGKDLKQGDKNQDVLELQKELNQCPATTIAAKGVGAPGKESQTFGKTTTAAVITFQNLFPDDILKVQNLKTGSGIVDEPTRKKLNAGFDCVIPAPVQPTILKSVVRFVEGGSSNIFDAFADTLETTRLSNTTLPRVHEALFGNNGQTVIMRYLAADNQTINTFIGTVHEPVVGGDALPELVGSLMPKNISELHLSPDGTQLLYMLESGQNMLGFISDLDGKNQKRVFSSPFYSWSGAWPTPTKLVFTVKPTGYGTGFAYSTDVLKGGFNKIAGPVVGLTTNMSPDGKYLLYNRVDSSGPKLMLKDMTTGQIRDLNIATLPEKCSWSSIKSTAYCAVPQSIPEGRIYPDDWYQGSVLFSDSFWTIDPTGLYSNQLLFIPTNEGGEETDALSLSIDPNDKYLYFTNKDTNILWQYDLSPLPTPKQPDATTTPVATPPAAQ
jgi:hypothetical protein